MSDADQAVAELAALQAVGGEAFDVEDGVVMVVAADGSRRAFTSFLDALASSGDEDTLYVGTPTTVANQCG